MDFRKAVILRRTQVEDCKRICKVSASLFALFGAFQSTTGTDFQKVFGESTWICTMQECPKTLSRSQMC